MKAFLDILNTVVSIASGTVTLIAFVGIKNVTDDTHTVTLSQDSLKNYLIIALVVFFISMITQKKRADVTNTTAKSQFQFFGKKNKQNMS